MDRGLRHPQESLKGRMELTDALDFLMKLKERTDFITGPMERIKVCITGFKEHIQAPQPP